MKVVVAIVVCLTIFSTVFAQSAPAVRAPKQGQLFTQTATPAPGPVPFPSHASFVTINTTVFDEVTSGRRNIDRIEDFPMPDHTTATLLVEEFDVLTPKSRIVAGTAQGDKEVAAPAHILLRGSIEGSEGSHVYLAVFREHCIGYLQDADAERILISPAYESVEGGMTMPHIIYNQYDVDPSFRTTNWHCGTEELPANQAAIERVAQKIQKSEQMQTPQATQVRVISIAVDCDNDFYKDFKSVFADAQNYAIAVLGGMSDLYMRDANCAVKASFLRVWQVEDPYTAHTTEELLPQFQGADISAERATSLLFSGDNALGGGLAFVDVLCIGDGRGYAVCGMYDNFVYPTDKYVWDSDVTSHEFGHNVGSLHTHNCNWNPPVDSCVASEGGCYSTPKPRKGTVMSYCHLTSSGTELKLHPRVGTFMKQQFIQSGCTTVEPVPTAKAPNDKLVCRDGSVLLNGVASGGTPPYKVLWFATTTTLPSFGLDTMTELNVNASPNRTIPYVFRVTDANNIRAYDTVIVAVDTVKVEIGAGALDICGMDKVTLSVQSYSGRGKVTFEWREQQSNSVVGTGETVVLPATDSVVYIVYAKDSIGCSASDVVAINPIPGLNAQITGPSGGTSCAGIKDTLDAGAGYSTYKWSTGATSRKILTANPGTYTCIVTKSGISCADTASFVLAKSPAPEKPKITLVGNTLKCPVSASSYQWYKQTSLSAIATSQADGESQDFVPKVNGYYHVKITEAGCSVRSDTLLVLVNGVNDEPVTTALKVYPNPASKSITIDAGTGPAITNLYITDMTGKTVWSSPRMTDQTQTVSISKWALGSYLLHYTSEGNQATSKFIKE